MSQLASIPIVLLLLSLQISLFSRFTLLNGFADILVIWLSAWIIQARIRNGWLWFIIAILTSIYVSGIPWYAVVAGYACIFTMGVFVNKRLWQSPLLSFYLVLIVGSLAYYFIAMISLQVAGYSQNLREMITTVIMPSLLLNIIFSLPIYLLARDLSNWLHPLEEIA